MTTEANNIDKLEVNFNDVPIKSKSDDKYGFSPFASRIARTIPRIKKPIGTTIAINGPWGSGKTSVLNLIKAEIKKEEISEKNEEVKEEVEEVEKSEKKKEEIKKVEISEFKCLWFRGEEALALAFLAHLSTCLGEQYKEIVKPLFGYLRKFSSLIAHAVELSTGVPCGGVVGTVIDTVDEVLNQDKSIEQLFQDLCDKLEKSDKRYLIVIDDIDRLSSKEILAVFRILRSIGQLPNVIYLLAFERGLVEQAIELEYPSDGGRFLEKIIQASFDIPNPSGLDLKKVMLSNLTEIFGTSLRSNDSHFKEIFDEIVMSYVRLPRHVERLRNVVSVTWPAIEDEVNAADFLGMEVIRIYDSRLFFAIEENRSLMFEPNDPPIPGENKLSELLSKIKEKKITTGLILDILFPHLQSDLRTKEFFEKCSRERRICCEAYFDTYYRANLNNDALSKKAIDDLINNADNGEYIKNKILAGKSKYCPSGYTESLRDLYELGSHVDRIKPEKIESFLTALTEIYDSIDECLDSNMRYSLPNDTFDIYSRLIRRSVQGMNIQERSHIWVRTLEKGALGWIIRFVKDSCCQNQEESNLLVSKEKLPSLKKMALDAIREARDECKLIDRHDLIEVLFNWEFLLNGITDEVREWTNSLMNDVESLLKIAKNALDKGYSISECKQIIDKDKFIDSTKDAELSDENKEMLRAFIKGENKSVK